MFRKRAHEFQQLGVSVCRLLLVFSLLQSLLAGALPSRAAPAAEQDSVTGFNLIQSTGGSNWEAVSGDLEDGFNMPLDPNIEWYYLDVENLAGDLQVGYHPFYVTSNAPAGWLAYWNDRGVNSGATDGWEVWMYQIIIGAQPIFYLKFEGENSYMLVDGLTRDYIPPYNDEHLRINGDYLLGEYTFTGTITDTQGTPSQLEVDMEFTMVQRQLSVITAGNGSGTVESIPPGIDCGSSCESGFDHNSVVTLTATTEPGSSFAGWVGDLITSTNPVTITMSANKEVTATFTLNKYLLTVIPAGTGTGRVESDPAGIDCGLDCTEEYYYNTVVTLTAKADVGSAFSGWSGSGISCPGTGKCEVTMSQAKTVTATFRQQYKLTVKRTGTGSGKVTSDPSGIDCGDTCEAYYDKDTELVLSAQADEGSTFTAWSVIGCSGATCPVTMIAAKTVTSTFTLNKYPLTVNLAGNGAGRVESIPAGIDCGVTCTHQYDYNTVVTLTAEAATGSDFTGWSGARVSSANPITMTLDAAKEVTATFTLKKYTLSVELEGSGAVTSKPAGINCGLDCTEDYDYNTVVTLTAAPDPGWSFFEWQGDLAGTVNPVALTMDEAKTVKAVFKQYFVYLPVIRRDAVFADGFDYDPPELVLERWEIVPDPQTSPNATWWVPVGEGEFHGKHTVSDKNSKTAAKVYAPQMPGAYSVEARLKLAAGSVAGARGGLVFDFKDNTRTYRFVIMPGLTSGDNWMVQKLVSGSWTYLSGGTSHGRDTTHMLARDQYNLLRVERRLDGSIKAYLNGYLLWQGSDTVYQNGRAGLNIGTPVGLGAGQYVEVIFDDFLIDSLP